MIDFSHTTISPQLSIYLPTGVGTTSWQTWQKPRGFTMCSIYAIGGGGGGGSGWSSISIFDGRAGGCGGGSGGISRLTIPLFLLPDTLFIRVLQGGAGGISGTDGANGSDTTVSIQPDNVASYFLLRAFGGGGGGGPAGALGGTRGVVATFSRSNPGSGYAVGNQIRLSAGNNNCTMQVATVIGTGVNTLTLLNGGSGYPAGGPYNTTNITGGGSFCTVSVTTTSSTPSLAGTAASIATAANCPLSQLGVALFIAGNAGALGGSSSSTAGASITQGTASQIYGGAGGGGANSTTTGAGGDISFVGVNSPFAISPGGVAGASPRAGGNGFSYTGVFPGKFYGGTGGGASNSVNGGLGGNGSAPGAGGGGGGGGIGLSSSQVGGNGGPGCVIIQCW